jgi:hypothetical protein
MIDNKKSAGGDYLSHFRPVWIFEALVGDGENVLGSVVVQDASTQYVSPDQRVDSLSLKQLHGRDFPRRQNQVRIAHLSGKDRKSHVVGVARHGIDSGRGVTTTVLPVAVSPRAVSTPGSTQV